MRIMKILPIVLLMILLGCVYQPSKEEKEVIKPTYGLSVEILGGNTTVTRGTMFSLMVSISNNGDFDALLKKVSLLGDILYVSGDVTKEEDVMVHKRGIHVATFSPLTVNTTIGKKTLEFYPAICYSYRTSAKLSFFITTSDEIFVSKKGEPLKEKSSLSPLQVDFMGFPIYKLTGSAGSFTGFANFNIKISGKNPKSWPVWDCSDLSNMSVRNIILKIMVPEIEGGEIKVEVINEEWVKENREGNEIIYKLNSSFYSYVRAKQGLRDILLTINISSSKPLDLEEIVLILDIEYDFYEIFPEEKAIFRVV